MPHSDGNQSRTTTMMQTPNQAPVRKKALRSYTQKEPPYYGGSPQWFYNGTAQHEHDLPIARYAPPEHTYPRTPPSQYRYPLEDTVSHNPAYHHTEKVNPISWIGLCVCLLLVLVSGGSGQSNGGAVDFFGFLVIASISLLFFIPKNGPNAHGSPVIYFAMGVDYKEEQ